MVASRTTQRPVPQARPIVRSSRLVHRGTTTLGPARQVLCEQPVVEMAEPVAEPLTKRRFRFAKPLVAAAVLSAGLARAEGPGARLSGAEPAAEVVRDAPVEPKSDELVLVPRLVQQPFAGSASPPGEFGQAGGVIGEALGAKVDGVKENPYETPSRGLVKKVPRAKRIAWKKGGELEFQKVSDLKSNPYE